MEYLIFGLFLALIVFGNTRIRKKQKEIWNDGICKEYNEPWELVDIVDYSDLSWDYEFKCRDKQFLVSPMWISDKLKEKLKL